MNKNKIIALIVILILLAAVAAYVLFPRSGGPAPVSGAPQASGTPSGNVPTNVAAPQPDTTGWKTYRSKEYGFSLHYPPDWTVHSNSPTLITIGHPLEGTATYALDIFVEENPKSLSSADYVSAVLAEDRAEDAQNAASGPAPTVTPQFDSSSTVMVGGASGYELYNVFEFDHSAERVYVAHGTVALRLDFPVKDDNPNLSSPAANNALAHEIVDTLSFTNPAP